MLSQKDERGLCDQVVEPSAAGAGLHALREFGALVGVNHKPAIIAFNATGIPPVPRKGQAKPGVEPVLHRVAAAMHVTGTQMPLRRAHAHG